MNDSPLPERQTQYLGSLFLTARSHPGLWIVPLVGAALIALLAGFLGPRQWRASQTFFVREELIGRIVGPGRFESLDTMKTAQETIGELARRPNVLKRTLESVGPEGSTAGANWPSEELINSLQGAIEFSAPGGADFGKTEMLTMHVKASSRERARQLAAALFVEVQRELRSLRQQRGASMIAETQQAVDVTTGQYNESGRRLREFESAVGPDLAELRILNEPIAGSGDLRKMSVQIQTEMRAARSRLETGEQLHQYLSALRKDPNQLVATPRELLESQPALARLKDKLIDAQVARATLGGNYTTLHPKLQAAENAVHDIEQQIFSELETAIAGLQSQRSLNGQEYDRLANRSREVDERLSELVAMRVDYGQLVDDLNQRRSDWTMAREDLSQAEAIYRAAETVDFVTPVDQAQASLYPLGPSTKMLLLGSIMAGGLIGLGLIMMATPVAPTIIPGQPAPVTANSPVHEPIAPATRRPRAVNPLAGTSVTTVGVPGAGFIIPDVSHVQVPTHVR